jgi:hypothetical protein
MEPQTSTSRNALYLVWKLNGSDNGTAGSTWSRLSEGQSRNLYRLRSWVITNGEARALIAPSAPLEQIAGAIWDSTPALVSSRWVAGTRACACMTREIEDVPVRLGLAGRPEEWRYSSAAA